MVVHTMEFHGRLCRSDGRPANPGTYDLLFQLHDGPESERALWEEPILSIPVAAGGFYHVVLGQHAALRADLFRDGLRWLAVRVVRTGKAAEEIGERVPVTGVTLKLGASQGHLEARVASLEGGGARPAVSEKTAKRLKILHRRLRRLEAGGGAVGLVTTRVRLVEERLLRIDGEEGRVTHLEDELEDLVGPDGDVVDLHERMDALEAQEPGLHVVTGGMDLRALEARIAALAARVEELEACLVARAPDPSPPPSPPSPRPSRARRAT